MHRGWIGCDWGMCNRDSSARRLLYVLDLPAVLSIYALIKATGLPAQKQSFYLTEYGGAGLLPPHSVVVVVFFFVHFCVTF